MDAAALVSFVEAHALASYAPGLPQRLITELARGPEGVFDLREGPARLLAVLVERVETATGAAILDLMAAEGAEGLEVRRALVGRAVRAARALLQGGRPLEVPLPHGWAGLDDLLIENGLTLNHIVYDMETAEDPTLAPRPRLPAGLRWELARGARLDEIYAVQREAFAGRPDVAFPELEVWRDMVRAAPIAPRALVAVGSGGDRAVGFVNVSILRPGLGQVRSIGRDPAWRGRGLGTLLLAEGMHLLAEAGARQHTLSVLATNAAALRLYQDAGFAVVREERVFLG